jgi:hypothetical protein
MVEPRSSICISTVYPCIDPDGGGNGSLTLACIRYLQPVSVLTLLSIAICVDWLARRASPAAMQRAAVLKQRM